MALFSSNKGVEEFDSDIYYKMMTLLTENK